MELTKNSINDLHWLCQDIVLPLLLGFIDDQENLKLLRCRDLGLLHQPCWGSSLLYNVGDGAEETCTSGLSWLGFPLWSWRSSWRCRPSCRRLGRGGGSRRRRLSRVRPLKVCHIAVGQVGDEGAVRQTSTQIIHGYRGERRKVNKSWVWKIILQRRPCSHCTDNNGWALNANSQRMYSLPAQQSILRAPPHW